MRRLAIVLALTALNCSAAADWVIVTDNEEYIAYADPATISRDGDRAQMSDLIDLKYPRSSPFGTVHASSMAHSEFDCRDSRMRTIDFSLYAGQMGDGDVVESVAVSDGWLPVAPGTLLNLLRQLACGQV